MMFGEDSKTQFIEQTRAARIERANDRKREQSAILVQSFVRGWLVRKRTQNLILLVFIFSACLFLYDKLQLLVNVL
jgi:ubiquitin-protein ligase E3 B